MPLLAILFAVTALLYASVGFGGGSTYNALLILNGVDYRILPAIALTCNLIVSSGGAVRFLLARKVTLRRMAPLIILSVPMAWLGGATPISETHFIAILAGALLASGLLMLFGPGGQSGPAPRRTDAIADSIIGGGVGFVSGLAGIGGGILLAPYLHMTRWGGTREIAGASSFFIAANSLAGLMGQLMKTADSGALAGAAAFWPLPVAVFIGGQIGSHLSVSRFNETLIKRGAAILILYVGVRLAWRWLSLMGVV